MPAQHRSPFLPFNLFVPDLVCLIAVTEFPFESFVYLQCIQCHHVKMTLDTPKINAIFEGKVHKFMRFDHASEKFSLALGILG